MSFDISVIQSGTGSTTVTATASTFSGPAVPQGSNYSVVSDPIFDKEIPLANATVGAEKCEHWKIIQQQVLKNFFQGVDLGSITRK